MRDAKLRIEQGKADDKDYEEIYGERPMEEKYTGPTIGGFAIPGGGISFTTEQTIGVVKHSKIKRRRVSSETSRKERILR